MTGCARLRRVTAFIAVVGLCLGGLGTSARTPDADARDMPVVRVEHLLPEARETLQRIARNGPFPYRRDGAQFANRERLLPIRERGYYREYTVRTPGSRDRGARRIVAGRGGERYYSDDHYRSFRRILE